jgi:hypothetical protein
MNITNPPKFLILMLALVCITILLATKSISQEAGLPLVSAIVFYGIGNGVGAKGKLDSPKIFGTKENKQ